MAENPWAGVPLSDPNERVYDAYAYAKTREDEVRPTPVYRGEALSSVVFCLAPGQEHAPHTHDSTTHVWVVLEGQGECLMEDGRTEPLRAGSICVHPETKPHGVRNTGSTNLVYVTVSASS